MQLHKRAGALACAGALSLTLAVPAGASEYPDLPESHWAYETMCQANALGIIQGTGGGNMNPSGTLTWGQFLTMMSRAFAPEEYEEELDWGLPWDQAGYTALSELGLIQKRDQLDLSLDDLGEPVTRQDAAVLLSRALPEEEEEDGGSWSWSWSWDWNEPQTVDPTRFTDWRRMDDFHQEAVSALADAGVIAGKDDGSFGYADTLQRADGATLVVRVLEEVDGALRGEPVTVTVRYIDQESGAQVIPERQVETTVGASLYSLSADVDVGDYNRYYDSGDPTQVSSACRTYTVRLQPMSDLEIQQVQFVERVEAGTATWEEYYLQDFWLYAQGTNSRKLLLLYGNQEQTRFASQEEAQAHMATVSVPVWTLSSNGSKRSSTMSLTVHSAIAQEVVDIFTEIYNNPEQFPMNSIGGYSWRGDSATGEHNCGTAIDINPNENYQIRNGQVLVGSCWEPGSNPYSISPESSVVRIFQEHGWSWGGDAWAYGSDDTSGYHDYMHFSYLGG